MRHTAERRDAGGREDVAHTLLSPAPPPVGRRWQDARNRETSSHSILTSTSVRQHDGKTLLTLHMRQEAERGKAETLQTVAYTSFSPIPAQAGAKVAHTVPQHGPSARAKTSRDGKTLLTLHSHQYRPDVELQLRAPIFLIISTGLGWS